MIILFIIIAFFLHAYYMVGLLLINIKKKLSYVIIIYKMYD